MISELLESAKFVSGFAALHFIRAMTKCTTSCPHLRLDENEDWLRNRLHRRLIQTTVGCGAYPRFHQAPPSVLLGRVSGKVNAIYCLGITRTIVTQHGKNGSAASPAYDIFATLHNCNTDTRG